MSSVDSRIVTMKFDNDKFNAGVADTLGALGKLKQALSFNKGSTGLENLNKEAGRFNLGPMESAVDGVSKSFLAMSTIAITALVNITNRAVNAGISLGKSLSLDQIIAGFQEYELKMGSIQTIMAGSGASLDVVNKKLQELNEYSDRTIYSFADMTTNIGKFTNAGVNLDTSVASIQGIANVAALSGANANEASRAMYNFAQALSKGYVQLIDWKSIELANMGTVEFKQQLIDAAEAQGMLTKRGNEWVTSAGKTVTATKGFNDSLTDQWLTTEVLNKTLGDYADETTAIGKKAFAAAQDVKTFSQLMSTVKESIGSGWAQTFEILIGNFDEAKELFTGINSAISSLVESSTNARNYLLSDWKMLGGRQALIDGLKVGFEALGKILTTVKEAFRQVFPPMTGQRLTDLTRGFRDFMQQLVPSEKTLENLRRIFVGVFSVIKIGVTVFNGIIGVVKDFFNAITSGSGGFLDFAGGIGDFLTKLGEMSSASGIIEKVFAKIGDGVGKAVGGLDSFLGVIRDVLAALKEFGSGVFSNLGDVFSNMFSGLDVDTLIKGVGAGGLATIGVALRKMVKNGIGVNFGGQFLDGISNALEGLTGVLKGMEQNLKANALLKIAGAIALLTASLVVLASIDSDALVKAITAMAVSFGLLLGTMEVITLIGDSKGIAKSGTIAAALIMISTAMLILSAAIENLSELSWSELLKGLVGIAASLTILSIAVIPLSKNSAGMVRSGLGLIFVATALRIMANAIKEMGSLNWGEIGKGLAGLAGSLLIMAVGIRMMPNMLITATGLLVLSVALNVIAKALSSFGKNDLVTIGKGLLAMGGSLVVIAGAMRLMPKNMLLISTGLVAVSVALNLIAAAVGSMGNMSWEEVARGLVALGGALAILAAGLYLMSGTIVGAAALALAAGSLMLLVPPLIALSTMTWGEISKGLIALAGAITVVGVAAAIFGLGAPLLLLGGAALLVFGVGLAAVGASAVMFAKAFSIAVAAAGAGAETIRAMLDAVIESIPKAMRAFGEGVVEFIKAIGNAHSEFVNAFSKILSSLISAIINNIPKMATMFDKMIRTGLTVIRRLFPNFLSTGFELVGRLLTGINNNVPSLVRKASDIIVKFLNALAGQLPKITAAGANLIVKLVNGIADNFSKIVDAGAKAVLKMLNGITSAVRTYSGQFRAAGRDLAYAIADGMTAGLVSKVGAVVSKARELASSAVNAVKGILRMNSPSKVFIEIGRFSAEGLANGLVKYSDRVKAASKKMGNTAVSALSRSMQNVSNLISADIKTTPVIKPVLDLSEVRKSSKNLTGLLAVDKMMAGVTYSQATSAAAERRAAVAQTSTATEAPAAKIEFTQINNSPKALSTIDIYRNTRSQLSLAKEALSV